MKTISIIGFDGPNKVGKGTQIDFLSQKLSNEINNCLVYIVRGDGTRQGKGNQVSGINNNIITFDPESEYWQEQYVQLKQKLIRNEIDITGRRNAAERLNRELYNLVNSYIPKQLNGKHNRAFVLLDRGILSRYFFELQQLKPLTIEQLLYLNKGSSNEEKKEIIIPEITFSLFAEKKVLQERFTDDEMQGIQGKFRSKLLNDHYPVFKLSREHIHDLLKEKMFSIDDTGDLSKQMIHQTICDELNKRGLWS